MDLPFGWNLISYSTGVGQPSPQIVDNDESFDSEKHTRLPWYQLIPSVGRNMHISFPDYNLLLKDKHMNDYFATVLQIRHLWQLNIVVVTAQVYNIYSVL